MPDVANTCWFVAASSGTADFSDGTPLTGMGNLASKATSTKTYTYRAEHPTDKSIWEEGSGVYNGTTLARTTISGSSTGSKIGFLVAPVVLLSPMKRDWDLLAPLNAPPFTGNGSITGTFGVAGVLSATNTTEAGAGIGALVVSGGLSAAKAIRSESTTAASSVSTGSGIFAGGLGVAGKGYFGGQLNVTDTTVSSSASTGSIVTAGGIGAANLITAGGGFKMTGGILNIDTAADGGTHIIKRTVDINNIVLEIRNSSGTGNTASVQFYSTDQQTWNANAAAIRAGYPSGAGGGRSINAGGTINASGADYAEYETKREDSDEIKKGQVVGFDEEGLLTDRWALAVTFGIKSTDPSYIGGDVWGNETALGMKEPREPVPPTPLMAMVLPAEPILPALVLPAMPELPALPDADNIAYEAVEAERTAIQQAHAAEVVRLTQGHAAEVKHLSDGYADERSAIEQANAAEAERYDRDRAAYDAAFDAYRAGRAEFAARLEAARQKVDRIAYSGKVPVNVTGAQPGDYIIAVQDGDGIGGIAVAEPMFEQYRHAVGRVRRIADDGRAVVAVIVH